MGRDAQRDYDATLATVRHKTHGNQQMLTWIDEAQADTVLSQQCPPLQADYIINLGDRTYGAGSQPAVYGSTSQT